MIDGKTFLHFSSEKSEVNQYRGNSKIELFQNNALNL